MSSPDWYEVLGVPADATTDEIRAAWKASVADLDPTAPSFRVFNAAAAVLLDAERRAEYDAARATEEESGDAGAVQAAEAAATGAVATVVPEAASAEPATPEAPADQPLASPARRSGRAGLVAGAVLAVLALVVAVLGVFVAPTLGRSLAGDPGLTTDQVDAAQAAARTGIETALAYDYRQLDEDERATLALMSEDFGESYASWFAYLKTIAGPNKAVATAKVLATAVSDWDDESVSVLVFLNQYKTNKATTNAPPEAVQVTLRMVERDGAWLIDDMDLNQSGQPTPEVEGDDEGDAPKPSGTTKPRRQASPTP